MLEDQMCVKIDISCVFRNLTVDPHDDIKLHFQWDDQLYWDSDLPFPYAHRSAAYQLVSDFISFIVKEKGHMVFPYLDDQRLVSECHQAKQAFDTLHNLIEELGLPINKDKYVPPTQVKST